MGFIQEINIDGMSVKTGKSKDGGKIPKGKGDEKERDKGWYRQAFGIKNKGKGWGQGRKWEHKVIGR